MLRRPLLEGLDATHPGEALPAPSWTAIRGVGKPPQMLS
jgi:hypothetical protein